MSCFFDRHSFQVRWLNPTFHIALMIWRFQWPSFRRAGAKGGTACVNKSTYSGPILRNWAPLGRTEVISRPDFHMQRLGDKPLPKKEGVLAPLTSIPHLPTHHQGPSMSPGPTHATLAQNGGTRGPRAREYLSWRPGLVRVSRGSRRTTPGGYQLPIPFPLPHP